MGLFAVDSVLLLLMLALSGTQDLLILWLMTCAISLSGSRRLQALVIANVAYVVISGSVLFEQTTLVTKPHIGAAEFSVLASRICGVVLLSALLLGLLQLNKLLRYRYVMSVNLLLLLGLLVYSLIAPTNRVLTDIIRGTTMLYSKYFWAIAFSVISLKDQPGAKNWMVLSSLTFWTPVTRFHIGAIPRGVGELIACERQSKLDLVHSRRSGVILVALGSIITAVNSGMPNVLFQLGYPFQRLPQLTSEFLTTTAPTTWLWIDSIVHGLQYFLRSAAQVSIAVGLVRFAGFHIPLAQFKIWKARNFSDLFRRIYFYYSETLAYFFFFPVWSFLRRLRLARTIETSASVFCSVLFGGLVIHGVLDVPYLLDHDFDSHLRLTASRLPYLLALALLSTLSTVFFVRRQPSETTNNRSLANAIHAAALFIVYLFCLGLVLPTVNQMSGLTTPSHEWLHLGSYVMKMLGL